MDRLVAAKVTLLGLRTIFLVRRRPGVTASLAGTVDVLILVVVALGSGVAAYGGAWLVLLVRRVIATNRGARIMPLT